MNRDLKDNELKEIMMNETECTTGSNPAGPTIPELGFAFFTPRSAWDFAVNYDKLNADVGLVPDELGRDRHGFVHMVLHRDVARAAGIGEGPA